MTVKLYDFINKLENFAALKGNNQIHLAFIDGTNVYQIDLVNVKNKKELYSFKEKSSFIDLARDIKGAFSIILLRALASTKDVSKAAEEVFNDQVISLHHFPALHQFIDRGIVKFFFELFPDLVSFHRVEHQL